MSRMSFDPGNPVGPGDGRDAGESEPSAPAPHLTRRAVLRGHVVHRHQPIGAGVDPTSAKPLDRDMSPASR